MSNFSSRRKVLRRNNGSGIGSFLVLVAVAAVIALIIAGIWQLIENKLSNEDIAASSSSVSQSEPSTSQSSESAESSSQSQPESSSETQAATGNSKYTYAVPKSDWVEENYFDDAVFFGDSITNGIQVYDVMSSTTVVSSTGITLDNILTKAVIKDGNGKYITMPEALKAANPKKIYIMIGANSLGWDKETFIKKYGQLLDVIKEQNPESLMYVQSILPVTAKKEEKEPTFANDKIDEYNLALMELTKSKGMQFLYVAEDFKDEAGCLPAEASPKDGMHFGRTYYVKWFDYLKTHTVKQ